MDSENKFVEEYRSIEQKIKVQGSTGRASQSGKWELDRQIRDLESLISEDLGEDVKLKFLQDKNQRINSKRNSRIVRNSIGAFVGAGITFGFAKYGTDSVAVIASGVGTLGFVSYLAKDVFNSANEYVSLFKLNDEKILKKYK